VFKFFENLVDPYTDYAENDTPPQRLRPFLAQYLQPFRTVFWVTGVLSVGTALVEIVLLWYLGRLVDVLGSTGPAQFWTAHGLEMAGVAFGLLFLRPALQTLLLDRPQ
jgi:ATP-binding cassette subfamily B multidrug efflux pump